MAGLPVGLGDLITAINGCITVYKKIKGAEEQIDDVGDRLNDVLNYVLPIQRHLDEKHGAAKGWPEIQVIRALVTKMRSGAEAIQAIFKRYYDEAKNPLTFGRLLFVFGSSPAKLESFITTIERQATSLARQVTFMDNKYQQRQLTLLIQKPAIGAVKKRMVNILFVDLDNTARSVVSQAYALLVSQWTSRSGGTWNVRKCHSAGLYIRDAQLVNEQQQVIAPAHLDRTPIGAPPNPHAVQALFDNNRFDYPYKQEIWRNCERHRSRTLRKESFQVYDYIFVYTFAQMDELQKLKSLIGRKYGFEWTPRGKGRITLLGQYRDGHTNELVEPRDNNRQGWNWCVPRLKESFRGWLKQELEWVRPPIELKADKPAS